MPPRRRESRRAGRACPGRPRRGRAESRSWPESRYGAPLSGNRGLALGGREHGVEQPREAGVDVLTAEREMTVGAFAARVGEPRLAQHLEVMRPRRLRDPEVELAARARVT